jgi:hypothetical protein
MRIVRIRIDRWMCRRAGGRHAVYSAIVGCEVARTGIGRCAASG